MLSLLLACHAPCDSGEGLSPAGECVSLSGQTGDSSPDVDWHALAEGCAEPAERLADPLWMEGSLQVTQVDPQDFVVELVDLERQGDLLLGVGQGGLMLYDVSAPEQPTLVSVFPAANGQARFHRVEVVGDGVVAVSHRDLGLFLVDIADPQHPTQVAEWHESGIEGLARVGDRLYVSSRRDGLLVIDVGDPRAPRELARFPGLPSTWELSASGGWLYAADNTLGVVPIDLGDPDRPVIGEPVGVEGAALHVRAEEGWLTVSTGGYGVVIMDLADPARPSTVAVLDTGGSVVMSDLEDGLLWAVDHQAVTVWDVTDPRDPIALGRQQTPQFALAVVAGSGDEAWVGDWSLIERWRVDRELSSPQLDLSARTVVLPVDGGSGRIGVRNFGRGPLHLLGASTGSAALHVDASALELGSGEEAWLRVTYDGVGALEQRICLASDDPDLPRQEIFAIAGETSGHLGVLAPDLSLTDLDGQTHRLSEQLGHPVVLAYFATW